MTLITRGLAGQGLITRGMAAVTVIIQQLGVIGAKLINYVFSSVHVQGTMFSKVTNIIPIIGIFVYYIKNNINIFGSYLNTLKANIVVKGRNLTLVNRILEFLDLDEEVDSDE